MENNNNHQTSAGKFQRLLDYLQRVGLDTKQLATQCQLDATDIAAQPSNAPMSSYQYSALYELAASELQKVDLTLPWGAGIGTDSFRFMCYSIIGCETLGQALARAERFENLLFPLTGYRIHISIDNSHASLHYDIDTVAISKHFAPEGWDRAKSLDTVAKGSGLKVWHALLGWLIGREVELDSVGIAAERISDDYANSLETLFHTEVNFNAKTSHLHFAADFLDYKLVHTPASLDSFLDSAIHTLITQQNRPASTGAALKSLLAKNGPGSPPSFEAMADDLHMSASSLRRRLNKEGISYQEIKDQYRRDIAIRFLKENELKIQDIGEKLGFLEPSSFIRSFKSWTGITPKQFQAQYSDKT